MPAGLDGQRQGNLHCLVGGLALLEENLQSKMSLNFVGDRSEESPTLRESWSGYEDKDGVVGSSTIDEEVVRSELTGDLPKRTAGLGYYSNMLG